MPEFPGGDKALLSYLKRNIKYPAEAQKNNEEGKVTVRFVVGKNGKAEKAEILKGVSPSLDKEALRLVESLPKWIPGEQNGTKVPVYQVVPVQFQNLTDEERWEVSEKTLVIIDSVAMPTGFKTNILNSAKLESVTVSKPFPKEEKNSLIKKYGKQAADGVVLIKTLKDDLRFLLTDSVKSANCKESIIAPEFEGGKARLFKYIKDSIQYPFVAKRTKTEGKVLVAFAVDTNGQVTAAKVIKPADYFLDKEAMRIISSLPAFTPGSACGEKVSFVGVVPVNFRLDLTPAERGWERNAKTIILLDGVRLPASFNPDWVNYMGLSSMKKHEPTNKEVIKKLVKEYGKDAVNGVIVMETAE
ncbi:MAG TPA: energy transducer TonB [Paludibacter sp.]|nr:energy transducer TonB [Paludibacter sp.]